METKNTVQEHVLFIAQDIERLIKQTYPEFSLETFKPKKRSKSTFVDVKIITVYMLEDWFKIGRMDISRCLGKHYATVIYYADKAKFFVKVKDAQFNNELTKVTTSINKEAFIEGHRLLIQDYMKLSSRKNKASIAA
jgi:hypothetical protein